MEHIIAYTASRAQGDPGPAAVGVYITDAAGAMLAEAKAGIGNSNDSFAAYYGVMLALQTLIERYESDTMNMVVEIHLESKSVQQQLNNELRISEPGLVPMFIEIHNMCVTSFPHISFLRISPETNTEATRLLDEALGGN